MRKYLEETICPKTYSKNVLYLPVAEYGNAAHTYCKSRIAPPGHTKELALKKCINALNFRQSPDCRYRGMRIERRLRHTVPELFLFGFQALEHTLSLRHFEVSPFPHADEVGNT